MKIKTILIAVLALCLAIVAIPAVAGAATSYVSVYSGWISDYGTTPQNSLGVYVTPTFPNDSVAFNVTHLHIKSSYYNGINAILSEGDSYDYYDAARITLLNTRVYDGTPQAYIDISAITNTSKTGDTEITCDTPGQIAKAGDTVTFPIVIKNDDSVDHTYSLATSGNTDWTTDFQYQGRSIYQIYVPQSQSKTVNLLIDTPYTADLGEKTFTVYADSYRMNLRVDVASVNQTLDVSTPSGSSVIASLGDKAYYDISLDNIQDQQNSYLLSVTGLPENWYSMYVSSKTSNDEMAETIVPASASKNLVLVIVPAASATVGDYNFTAVIQTSDGLTVTKPLALKLKGGATISTSYDKLQYSSTAGTAFNIKVYVANSGKGAALTNVYPSVEAPSGWTVSTSPETISTVKAGESQVFTVNVQPPANIVASDYDIKVTMKSDQATADTLSYRITITTNSYIPYIAGAIILIVLIGIVVVFRKFGRR